MENKMLLTVRVATNIVVSSNNQSVIIQTSAGNKNGKRFATAAQQ